MRKNSGIPVTNGRENYADSQNYRKFTRKCRKIDAESLLSAENDIIIGMVFFGL